MQRLSFLILTLILEGSLWGQNSTDLPSPLLPFSPTVSTRTLKAAGRTVTVQVESYGDARSWVFVHLHGTEPTSVQAAKEILPLTGGYLIGLENGKNRNLKFEWQGRNWLIDPNRLYSDTGIRMNLKELNKYRFSETLVEQIKLLGEQITSLIPDTANCIVALHNNSDGHFSISDYLPGGKRQKDARRVFSDPHQDPDDIVLTSDSLLYEHMAAACFNTIWQDSAQVKRDGSLSVYAALRGRRYVNIETEHGRQEQYARMLQHLMLYLVREREILLARQLIQD